MAKCHSNFSQTHEIFQQPEVVPCSYILRCFYCSIHELQAIMIRQIQKRPIGSVATPLFLFHDASGTISNYRALGPMGRDVYAIADSRMKSNPDESLQEMSRRYYALIKSICSEGSILLGGNRHVDALSHKTTDRISRLVSRRHDCTSSRMDLLPRS